MPPQLVPGDIIKLEAGDYIPADARIIESASLKSEEAALTGEPVPSEKDAHADGAANDPLGDRHTYAWHGMQHYLWNWHGGGYRHSA